MHRHNLSFVLLAAFLFSAGIAAPTACSSDGATAATTASGGGSASAGHSAGSISGGGGASCTGTGKPGPVSCPTTFTFHPSGSIQNPKVAGEWQGFNLATAPSMTGPDVNGVYSA